MSPSPPGPGAQPNRLRTLATLPVLAAQAAWVAARVPRLPEAAGPRCGRTGAGPVLRLLVVGDSSAAGVGVAHQSEALSGQLVRALAPEFDVTWQLIARSGTTTAGALARLRQASPAAFDVALTALGVNDVKNGVPLGRWLARTEALHTALRDRFGVRLVVASGLPPMGSFPALPGALGRFLGARAGAFDAALRARFGGRPGTVVLPGDLPLDPAGMAADGFHPRAAVYADWAARAAAAIRAAWPEP
jgi:lysophospholipase L1-like esterase